MHIEEYREYCISKKGVTEELPFGPETLVFKVMGKVFVLTPLDTFESVNLKCDPEEAVKLREKYYSIIPCYHMNKKHLNTVILDGTISDKLLKQLTDHSYELVTNSLTKKEKEELKNL